MWQNSTSSTLQPSYLAAIDVLEARKMCNGKPRRILSSSCQKKIAQRSQNTPISMSKTGFYRNLLFKYPRLWPLITFDHRHLGRWNLVCSVIMHRSWDSQSLSTIWVDPPLPNFDLPKRTVGAPLPFSGPPLQSKPFSRTRNPVWSTCTSTSTHCHTWSTHLVS